MALTQDDVKMYKSTLSGSAGGARAGTTVTSSKNSLFDNVNDTQRVAGGTVIKKWFLANDNHAESWPSPSVWIAATPAGCTESLGFGWDDAEDDDQGQGNMVAWDMTGALTVVSDAADARTVEVYGKNGSGVAVREVISLNGTTPATSTNSYTAVYACRVSAVSTARSVTVQRAGSGVVRGSIAKNYKTCWLWLSPTTKETGFALPSLTPGQEYGFWDRVSWPSSATPIDLAASVIGAE